MSKLRIGLFSFTGDEGCMIVLMETLNTRLERWGEEIDIVCSRIFRKKWDCSNLDVAFVEGAIATEHEKEMLGEIRKNAKKLVAIGSCAITGMPSAQRNSFDEETKKEIALVLERFKHLPRVLSVKEVVQVDAEIPGCPMDENKFVEFVENLLKQKNME
jgi:sulfhydrogenase subunit delta